MADKDTVMETEEKEVISRNFIEQEIDKDLAEGVYDHVQTRFPPRIMPFPDGNGIAEHAPHVPIGFLVCPLFKPAAPPLVAVLLFRGYPGHGDWGAFKIKGIFIEINRI